MVNLQNATFDHGRIISNATPYDPKKNRGIRTHNKFTKIFVDFFGTKTIEINVNGKVYYANRGSCFKLINPLGSSSSKKSEIIANLQFCFSKYGLTNPSENAINNTFILVFEKVSTEYFPFLMSWLKFLKFLAAENGIEEMHKAFTQNKVYWFRKADLEIPFGFPFRFSDTWEESKQDLENLLANFIKILNQDEQSLVNTLSSLTPNDFNFNYQEKLFLTFVNSDFISWKKRHQKNENPSSKFAEHYIEILKYLNETSGDIPTLEELTFKAPIDFDSKKNQISILNHMMRFVIENLPPEDNYANSLSVIKFFKFLCEENGMKHLEKNFVPKGPFYFKKPDLEAGEEIPFRYEDTWDESKKGLVLLMIHLLKSYTTLISDEQRLQFFSKFGGEFGFDRSIKGRTSAAIKYAASLQS